MLCPFLREATVTSCRQAPAARALPLEAIDLTSSRCNGSGHASCPYAPEEAPAAAGERCPALEERRVRYCVAASAAKPVPALSMLPSRCSTDAHRHCSLYLERTVVRPAGGVRRGADVRPFADVDGVEVPHGLAYTANHLWVDRGSDGSCTVGVDAFLVRAIATADRVTFVSTAPGTQPFAVLSVADLELPLAFPYPLERTVVNYALRVEPGRLASDPYGSGWLFEGDWTGEPDDAPASSRRLVSGADAVLWMRREVERLSTTVHDLDGERTADGLLAAADGGTFAVGVARIVRREDALRLFAGFFPVPPAIWGARCKETS